MSDIKKILEVQQKIGGDRETISEIEDRSTQTIQSEEQGEKKG